MRQRYGKVQVNGMEEYMKKRIEKDAEIINAIASSVSEEAINKASRILALLSLINCKKE